MILLYVYSNISLPIEVKLKALLITQFQRI